ncbi:unnamed protein product [Pleuronectes platessa]|uniref:Uncharacterized protein n=1 Tax=Pleuronectes platessa TaxID=8262 RepID=A0A9N7W3I1_PLEPL|nr:unnamed protein product [Pleuronectes platessa]
MLTVLCGVIRWNWDPTQGPEVTAAPAQRADFGKLRPLDLDWGENGLFPQREQLWQRRPHSTTVPPGGHDTFGKSFSTRVLLPSEEVLTDGLGLGEGNSTLLLGVGSGLRKFRAATRRTARAGAAGAEFLRGDFVWTTEPVEEPLCFPLTSE